MRDADGIRRVVLRVLLRHQMKCAQTHSIASIFCVGGSLLVSNNTNHVAFSAGRVVGPAGRSFAFPMRKDVILSRRTHDPGGVVIVHSNTTCTVLAHRGSYSMVGVALAI